MKVSRGFIRAFFVLLSIFFMTAYTTGVATRVDARAVIYGVVMGLVYGAILIGIDLLFRRFSLRSFNVTVIGLFFGYLMGLVLVLIFNAIFAMTAASFSQATIEIIRITLFLFGTYMGVMMTLRASDELYVSIPFVKFTPEVQRTRDLLLDLSILGDSRLIDLASSGIIDKRVVLPRFLLKELYSFSEHPDEMSRTRARRSLDVIKKLEGLPSLELRYNDTDFPEVQEVMSKLVRLARLIDGDILTADISRVQSATIEGVRVINIHSLSNALKPIMEAGEYLRVKVQRYGKEPRQGVGYLEDGTMVVVNGGGDFLEQEVLTRVLSVKHTKSGRMVFCNIIERDEREPYEE